MQSFQPVSVTRLYRMIANQIGERIDQGDFPAGCRLPSERDLAEQLQVSRASVREALIALEIEGRVEVRIGSGVYVRDSAGDKESPTRSEPGLLKAVRVGRSGVDEGVDIGASGDHPVHTDIGAFELLHVHLLVEPEAAALAAKHGTAEQHEAIRLAAVAMENSSTPRWHNRLFHIAVGAATSNAAMALTVKQLWDMHDDSVMFHKLEQHVVGRRAWELAEHEHDDVVTAILSRDADAAKVAMRRHFTETRKRLRKDFKANASPY
jgi:DNA-binding FadR family transcriptional regulator